LHYFGTSGAGRGRLTFRREGLFPQALGIAELYSSHALHRGGVDAAR